MWLQDASHVSRNRVLSLGRLCCNSGRNASSKSVFSNYVLIVLQPRSETEGPYYTLIAAISQPYNLHNREREKFNKWDQ